MLTFTRKKVISRIFLPSESSRYSSLFPFWLFNISFKQVLRRLYYVRIIKVFAAYIICLLSNWRPFMNLYKLTNNHIPIKIQVMAIVFTCGFKVPSLQICIGLGKTNQPFSMTSPDYKYHTLIPYDGVNK